MRHMRKVADLATHDLDEITGRDSFCYVDMGGVPDGLLAVLTQKGRFPLSNVGVTITDLDSFDDAIKSHRLPNSSDYRTAFPMIPFLSRASLFHPLMTYRIGPANDYKRYNVEMYARNGAFTELLRAHRIKQGGWSFATLVVASYFTNQHGIVREDITKDFPLETLEQDKDWITFKKQ